jgi:hypothetical protein
VLFADLKAPRTAKGSRSSRKRSPVFGISRRLARPWNGLSTSVCGFTTRCIRLETS